MRFPKPVRLAIVAVLAGCESADFTYLLNATKINKGTLSKSLSALEDVEYVEITKGYKGKIPNTSVKLTAKGRRAFAQYRRQHRRFIDSAGEMKHEGRP
ncbi:MAG: ArsR family transcriptional regulator [Anaerolineales bacterium]|nr:MAG: ArsR family transcriptional regulator [Anaerolineales bacterium]